MTNSSKTAARKLTVRAWLRWRREGRAATINSEEAVRALAAVGKLFDGEVAVDLGPHLSREVGGGDVLVVGKGRGLTTGAVGFGLLGGTDGTLKGVGGDFWQGRVFNEGGVFHGVCEGCERGKLGR